MPAKDDDSDRFDRNLDRRALREKTELTPARILFHEYVHHFMLQNFSTSYPHWYLEGFAELYGTLELFDDGTFRIGNVPQHRGEALFALSDVRLTRLFDHNKRLDGQDLYQSYSFGWLLAHYLNFNPERRGQLAAYLKALNAGEDSLTAAKRIFGDLDKLQGELRKYKGGPFPTMDVKPAHYVAPKVVMRQLTAGEEAVMRAHIRSERGVSKREAQQVVDEVDGKDRQYSDNLAVQLITAEAYTDAGEFAKAEAALKRALVIAPELQEANVLMGNMFMARAKKEKDNAVYAQARPWFTEAYRLDPKDPRAAIGYYMTYYQAREAIPEPALIALESVFDYSSYDDGYRLVLARQLLDENKGKLARSVLAPLAFSSHKQAEANKVAEVVDAIDAGQIRTRARPWPRSSPNKTKTKGNRTESPHVGRVFEARPMLLISHLFALQKFAFDWQAIGIAAERAVAAHDAVARDEDRDIVGAVGAARGAHRLGLADRGRDVGVAARLARRYLAQFAPDRFLKGGALHVDRNMVETGRRRLDRIDHLLQQRGEIGTAFDQFGGGEARLERVASFGEAQAAHALGGRRDQHVAKARRYHRPVNCRALAAVHPCRSGHSHASLHRVVKARRPRKARVIDGVGHAPRLAQRRAGALFAQRPCIGGWRQPGVAGEDALKMGRRIAGTRRKIGERERLFAALDRGDCGDHGAFVARDIVGQAALARA